MIQKLGHGDGLQTSWLNAFKLGSNQNQVKAMALAYQLVSELPDSKLVEHETYHVRS